MFITRYKKLLVIISFVVAGSCHMHAADLVPRPAPGVQSLSSRIRSSIWQLSEDMKRKYLKEHKLWQIQLQEGTVNITDEDMLALANESKVIGNLLTRSDDPITLEILENIADREIDLSKLVVAGNYLTTSQIDLLIKIIHVLVHEQGLNAQASIERLINSQLQERSVSEQLFIERINKIIELCALADALNITNLTNVCTELLIKELTKPIFLQAFAADRALLDKINLSWLPIGFIDALSANSDVVNWIAGILPASWWSLRTLAGPPGMVYSVAFSPDGRTLASSGHDQRVRLWDIATGTQGRILGGPNPVFSVAFSPDKRLLAAGFTSGRIILWDLTNGTQVRTLSGDRGIVQGVIFSPDSQMLVSASDSYDRRGVILWDIARGDRIRTLTANSDMQNIALSPDGSTLAAGGLDRNIILWDVSTGAQIRILIGHARYVSSIVFSPDGRIVASGSDDGSIILWDVATGAQIRTLAGHRSGILSIAFSPDGRTIASSLGNGSITLWDVSSGRPIHTTLAGPHYIARRIVFNPSGQILASCYSNTVKLWKTLYQVSQYIQRLSLDQILSLLAKSHGFDVSDQEIEAILPQEK